MDHYDEFISSTHELWAASAPKAQVFDFIYEFSRKWDLGLGPKLRSEVSKTTSDFVDSLVWDEVGLIENVSKVAPSIFKARQSPTLF